MNETLVRAGGRNVLRVERRFAHPPEKVWRAITEPAELAAWFPSPVEINELRAGAPIRFVGEGFGHVGTISEADPPRVFAFDWEGELLRFELSPAPGAGRDGGDGTVLVFTHAFDDRAGAASFAAGWLACFDALETRLAGVTARPPSSPQAMTGAHERFVALLGLDEGEAEETADGWRIRFERQLSAFAPAAWELLTGGRPLAPGEEPPFPLLREGGASAPLREVEPERALAYGTVRWELREGTGQGARLLVTEDVPAAAGSAARDRALAAWRARVEAFAAALAAQALAEAEAGGR